MGAGRSGALRHDESRGRTASGELRAVEEATPAEPGPRKKKTLISPPRKMAAPVQTKPAPKKSSALPSPRRAKKKAPRPRFAFLDTTREAKVETVAAAPKGPTHFAPPEPEPVDLTMGALLEASGANAAYDDSVAVPEEIAVDEPHDKTRRYVVPPPPPTEPLKHTAKDATPPVVERDDTRPPIVPVEAAPAPRKRSRASKPRAAASPTWLVGAACAMVGLAAGLWMGDGADRDQPKVDAAHIAVAGAVAAPTDAAPTDAAPVEVNKTRPRLAMHTVAAPEAAPEWAGPPYVEEAEVGIPEEDASPRRRWRKRRKKVAEQTYFEPEFDPEPVARPTPKPRPPSAASLLKKAESAFENGQLASAYRLAKRSHRADSSAGALKVMVRAACRQNDRAAAFGAVKKLPLLQRGSVRRDCRRHGQRIGLRAP